MCKLNHCVCKVIAGQQEEILLTRHVLKQVFLKPRVTNGIMQLTGVTEERKKHDVLNLICSLLKEILQADKKLSPHI